MDKENGFHISLCLRIIRNSYVGFMRVIFLFFEVLLRNFQYLGENL